MTKKESKPSIQEKLDLIIERNKSEASILKKIIMAIEQKSNKSTNNNKNKS